MVFIARDEMSVSNQDAVRRREEMEGKISHGRFGPVGAERDEGGGDDEGESRKLSASLCVVTGSQAERRRRFIAARHGRRKQGCDLHFV